MLTPQQFSGKACFIDGGNSAIFESPSIRVEFVRVYGCVHEGIKKVAQRQTEGFIVLRYVSREGKSFIELTGYPPLDFNLLIPDDDREVRTGRERVQLGAAAGIARFMLECRFAREVAQEQGCALVVRDGALLGMNRFEEEALAALVSGTSFHIAGVCKTNTLLTSDGRSATTLLSELAPVPLWGYRIGEVDSVELHAARLHARAEHAFRVDISPDASAEAPAQQILGYFASLSADPVFPGYPYPLIAADRLARVSSKESALLRTRFMVAAGERWPELQRLERGSDAHGILDRIL